MRITYFDNYDKKLCNGCGACKLSCPKNCIKMVQDKEGFFYPQIDEDKCIHCNKCKKICSNFNDKKEENEKAYAVINKSKKYLELSSSGGMFLLLAEYVIKKGGVVFGAKYTGSLEVVCDYAETIEEVIKFSGSKYVRSDLRNSYKEVKNFLENDRYVLFTGTPCQVNGLRKYLEKEYNKLILCDIICYANPSPKVFKIFIKALEEKEKNKVNKISFRGAESGWKERNTIIQYDDGKKIIENSFTKAFNNNLINRTSCYSCPFASKRRISDITIGDLWGAEEIVPNMEIKKGISLVLINSTKAAKIFDELKEKMKFQEINYDEACSHNHFKNISENKKRNKFFKLIEEKKINENNIINVINKYTKPTIIARILRKAKSIIVTK